MRVDGMRVFDQTKTREIENIDLEKGYLVRDKLFVAHHEEIPEKVIKTVEQLRDELISQGKEVLFNEIRNTYELTLKYYPATDKHPEGRTVKVLKPVIEEGKEAWDEYEDIQVYIPYTEEQLEERRVAKLKSGLSQKISSIVFVKMAEQGEIDDITSSECVYAFTSWQPNINYEIGNLREHKGALYKCLQAHTSQADWMPDVSVSLWKKVGDPREEYPEWSQPIGAFDAYQKDDKVTHNGKKWHSAVDNNVWEPGVFGWEEETEE